MATRRGEGVAAAAPTVGATHTARGDGAAPTPAGAAELATQAGNGGAASAAQSVRVLVITADGALGDVPSRRALEVRGCSADPDALREALSEHRPNLVIGATSTRLAELGTVLLDPDSGVARRRPRIVWVVRWPGEVRLLPKAGVKLHGVLRCEEDAQREAHALELFVEGDELALARLAPRELPRTALEHELTRREFEVGCLLALGWSYRQIGSGLDIGRRTVDTHLQHLRAKLGESSSSGLRVAFWANGWMGPIADPDPPEPSPPERP